MYKYLHYIQYKSRERERDTVLKKRTDTDRKVIGSFVGHCVYITILNLNVLIDI